MNVDQEEEEESPTVPFQRVIVGEEKKQRKRCGRGQSKV